MGRRLDEILTQGVEQITSTIPGRPDPTTSHECSVTDRSGVERWLEVRQSIIWFDGRECVLSVWRDVTRQREYERELVDAKNEAENASRMKSTILANLSHEIRTPLTAILGFSDAIDEAENPPITEIMDLIHRSGIRLKDTLESILTLAELESGGMAYEPVSMDIRDVVRSTAEIFSGQARRKGLSFDVVASDAPVRAAADPTALSQIVMNLVSNAVKFTDGGSVAVNVEPDGEHALVVVSDTGIGIDDRHVAQIFDEFVQLSDGLDREYEGAGIGLTIVRQLVEMQDGSIDVETRKGDGTRFTVRLPAA